MLIVLIIISILGIILCFGSDADEFGVAFVLGFCLKVLAFLVVLAQLINGRVIDDKIAMYEGENSVIESQIEVLVERYMQYEQDTFAQCSSESAITLIDLFPELKADTLVSKQIEIYVENNKKIKDLKEKKINMSAYRWWLYFGK